MKNIIQRITTFGLALTLLVGLSAEQALAQRTRSRAGLAGGQASQATQVNRQGNGAYNNDGNWQYQGPKGNSAGATSTGQGKWTYTNGQGVNNSYNGNVTTNNGNNYDVDHNADYNYTQDEGVDRSGSTTVTNDQGETVGNSQSSGNVSKGNGYSGNQSITGKQGSSAVRKGQASYGQGRSSTTRFNDKSGTTRFTRGSSGGQ